jgi:hypothetical protein
MYDFHLGGTNNSVADRKTAREVREAMPDILKIIQEYRSYHRRSVGLMRDRGINQFIDIGSGFLTSGSTHKLIPDAAVVYVDIHPAVFKQGSGLLAASETTAIICADIRQPQNVLGNPDLARLINFSEPVGVLMVNVACFFKDSEITDIMSTLQSKICDGSYIAVSHETLDGHKDEEEKIAKVQEIYRNISMQLFFRSKTEISLMFQGLHLVEPGVAFIHELWIGRDLPAPAAVKWLYGVLAIKNSSAVVPAAAHPHMQVGPMQAWKSLNSPVFASTSLLVIICSFFTMLAQLLMDTGITSFQQLRGMTIDQDGKLVWG